MQMSNLAILVSRGGLKSVYTVLLEALLPGGSQITIGTAERSSSVLKLPDLIVRIAVPDTWWSPSITSMGTF